MRPQFDHERLKVYGDAGAFCAWTMPLLERMTTKIAARDQLDRASTSIVLNLAEGNGKRSYPDRSRYFDIARRSALECAGCLDVLVARRVLELTEAEAGKARLIEIVSMIAGLLARFAGSGRVEEEQAPYGSDRGRDLRTWEKEKDKE